MGRPPPELHDCAMLVGWTLKDMGWILLCAPMAVPAFLLAFCAEAHLVATTWREATTAGLVHHFADACWLLGNMAWMSAEFLYADGEENRPGRQFPWYTGPLLGMNNEANAIGVNLCRAIFCAGLLPLLGFYTLCVLGYTSLDGRASAIAARESAVTHEVSLQRTAESVEAHNDDEGGNGTTHRTNYGTVQQQHTCSQKDTLEREKFVFGVLPPALYLHLFIGPWIAKDLAWTFEFKLPLLVFSLITIALGIDYVRRFGGEVIRAELLWMIGDTIWAYGEVWQDDWKQPPREVAAVFLVLALLNVATGACRTIASAGEARTKLLGGPVKDEEKPFALAGSLKAMR